MIHFKYKKKRSMMHVQDGFEVASPPKQQHVSGHLQLRGSRGRWAGGGAERIKRRGEAERIKRRGEDREEGGGGAERIKRRGEAERIERREGEGLRGLREGGGLR
jgi:hypothetical protein